MICIKAVLFIKGIMNIMPFNSHDTLVMKLSKVRYKWIQALHFAHPLAFLPLNMLGSSLCQYAQIYLTHCKHCRVFHSVDRLQVT